MTTFTLSLRQNELILFYYPKQNVDSPHHSQNVRSQENTYDHAESECPGLCRWSMQCPFETTTTLSYSDYI